MVQVSQTEDEIKITIKLNRLINKKPDIVLFSDYVKFNNPPIFFERHLANEINENSSYCRIFKTEARIVLIKRTKGIWPDIFQDLSKDELLQRRKEIGDRLIGQNQARDKEALERYEKKRRSEIEKEIRRESAHKDKIRNLEETACREGLKIDARQSDCEEERSRPQSSNAVTAEAFPAVRTYHRPQSAKVRSAGKIRVTFSQFTFKTPKRESQEGRLNEFICDQNIPIPK